MEPLNFGSDDLFVHLYNLREFPSHLQPYWQGSHTWKSWREQSRPTSPLPPSSPSLDNGLEFRSPFLHIIEYIKGDRFQFHTLSYEHSPSRPPTFLITSSIKLIINKSLYESTLLNCSPKPLLLLPLVPAPLVSLNYRTRSKTGNPVCRMSSETWSHSRCGVDRF